MGHDYLDLGESHVRLNDAHIWVLRHLFLRCLSEATPTSLGMIEATHDEFKRFFTNWAWLGPGVVVGTDLDAFLTTPSRLQSISRLFDVTLTLIDSIGTEIPLSYLERNVNDQSAQFRVAQPTSIFRNAIQTLKQALPDDA